MPFANRKAVYELYVADSKDEEYKAFFDGTDNLVASLPYFCFVWNKDARVQHIVVRKYLRFALCDVCVQLIDERRNACHLNAAVATTLAQREAAHYKSVRLERQEYYVRRVKGTSEPEEYMSIIIDGADQQVQAFSFF